MPVLAVGDDVQEAAGVFHVVGVAWGDGLPAVVGWVGGGLAERVQEPVAAVVAVVGEGLGGPLAGDQDAAAGVAEVFAAVGLALAGARAQAGAGVLGLDAVAEPVGARGEQGSYRSASTSRATWSRWRRWWPGGSRRRPWRGT